MNATESTNAPRTFKTMAYEAIRYWEPRRIIYNLVLVALVFVWASVISTHFPPAFTQQELLALLILAVIANVCYSTAYLAEAVMQRSSIRALWQQARWGVWLAGTLFAIALACWKIVTG